LGGKEETNEKSLVKKRLIAKNYQTVRQKEGQESTNAALRGKEGTIRKKEKGDKQRGLTVTERKMCTIRPNL